MRPRTEDERKYARDMRAAGRDYREIDKALRCRTGSTQRQLESAEVGSKYVPAGLLAERDALVAAREQRTLTQDFCGDPPPGCSALHGKTGLR
jgi:hypothetical protein